MRPVRLLLLFLVLVSCHYLETKKVHSDDLLNEELKTFNWNDVDTYPTFNNCDSITDKVQSKSCFQNTMLSHISSFLQNQNLVVAEDVNDIITMRIAINKEGMPTAQSIEMATETRLVIPEIDSLLRQSLISLPKIYPAIKRNQQVTTVFELPIIIKIQ